MKDMLKATWRIIGFNIRNMIIFEGIYRFLTTTLMLSLLSHGVEWALKHAGYSYVTAKNLLPFLTRPFTLLILLGLLVLHGIFLLVEVGALITSNQGAVLHHKIGPVKMLIGGLKKSYRVLREKGWVLIPVTFILTLFMNLFPLYRILDHVKPISFLMAEIWGSRPLSLLMVAGIGLLGIFTFAFLFLPNICLLEKQGLRSGSQKGWRMLKENLYKNILLVLLVNFLTLAFFIIMYVLLVACIGIGVILFYDKNLALAIMLMACDRMELVLIGIGSVASLIVNFSAIMAVYARYETIRVRAEELDLSWPMKQPINKKMVLACWAGIFLLYVLYIHSLVQNGTLMATKAVFETQITAHRGSSYMAPENTIPAIGKAMEELADFAEIDVQETKDGVLVLLHDYNLKRTTGYNGYIWNMDFAEVSRLDAGYLFGGEYAGTKIPTLEETLEFCKGRIKLNIELKNNGRDPELAVKALALIEEYSFEQQCVITSTSIGYLREIKELNPAIKTGYIITAGYGNYYEDEAVDFISIRSSFVTSSLISAAHSYGKEVYAWTVNTKPELERMKLLGVDNVITDRPVFAREILFREKNTESLFEYIKIVLK